MCVGGGGVACDLFHSLPLFLCVLCVYVRVCVCVCVCVCVMALSLAWLDVCMHVISLSFSLPFSITATLVVLVNCHQNGTSMILIHNSKHIKLL